MSKRAIVTGITGQDGSYLAELLLEHGYEVVGVARRLSAPNHWRIAHLLDRIELRPADLLDQLSLIRLVDDVRPHEIYNLAAMSFVPASWDQPILTGEFNSLGVTRMLEAVRHVDTSIRVYQASSSEMFGKVRETPQNEQTPFYPRSPYGVSKVFAHYITVNYRESYDMYAVSGILFNHESPRRGLEFVTRKVSDGVARIKAGLAETLALGNLDARRDWGFAGDYVRAIWSMLQQERADDYVIATGTSHSVRDLVETAFSHAGLDWRDHVRTDPALMRPAEVEHLVGDPSRAKAELGWRPSVDFEGLIRMMVDADVERVARRSATAPKAAPPPRQARSLRRGDVPWSGSCPGRSPVRAALVADEALDGAARRGVAPARDPARQVAEPAGAHREPHRLGHGDGVVGSRDRRVDEHAVGAQLHRHRGVRRRPDPGVDDDRDLGLLADDGEAVAVLHAEPGADRGAEGHDRGRAGLGQLAADDRVVVGVGEDDEPLLGQHARCREQRLVVREERPLVADDLQLHPVREPAERPSRAVRIASSAV